ncbi:beta-Pak interactive eXchange factor Src-like 3 domain protein (macronuclear) [Tetrahymena thermophila SB210]|uniref:Beta-Pak interactive eXchange factor Src-like 3 domain protein n=1 Tax=Tetrahymena thermophila (strain SB210) TaxID=312017 RepID=I7LX01_TETTS|nr:beta-Pak interactive eXchange factor Src-like 3 domain protein [Tetrahymena thermophila SB210]EAS03184.1 beta-Pak interactive eXchange factor Src-like 3 domain protein [Tetrahymena thermophila SB210]|eukprot:XP_001023429.1 beta-Pak interactive eXchange factor Src-like 3 domain protein [Tetrahymena thermophila SB210]
MFTKSNSRSALAGLNSIVNSQNDSLTSRAQHQNYAKKDLTISNSTSNLSQTIQQYQMQFSSSSQQINQNQKHKYFLNNSNNGPVQNVSSSLEKKPGSYFFKNGIQNQSKQQNQYISQQFQQLQKSFDSLQRQNSKSELNSSTSAVQNRVKTSRSIINYNLPELTRNKEYPASSRNLSPITLNQLDSEQSQFRNNLNQQENLILRNSSKSPSSILNSNNNNNNTISLKNNISSSSTSQSKILGSNINISNIFKSSNSNHLLLSNAIKKQNTSCNLASINQQQNNLNQQITSSLNNENSIKPLSSMIRQEKSSNSQNLIQRTERSNTNYEQSDPKKQKIVENIIENILNTEPSIQENINQIGLHEENRNLLNNQKKLAIELESLRNANQILSKENQELKEAIKIERDKFKEELTKLLYEINNMKQFEDLYVSEKSLNEKIQQNLKKLEDSFMNYKSDIVGLIYDTFEIVLSTKGFTTHLRSVQLSLEESQEVYRAFLKVISKKSSDLMNKLNPFVIDLEIQNELKEFGNQIKNDQKNMFFESLQSFNEKNKNFLQEKSSKQNNLKIKEEGLQKKQVSNEEKNYLEVVLNDFEDDRCQQSSSQQQKTALSQQAQSDYVNGQQQELSHLKSILTSTMSHNNFQNIQENENNNNSNKSNSSNQIKIKSVSLETKSNQEISCQYSQDQLGSSIQSSRFHQKSNQVDKIGIKLQDYISFNTNDNYQEGQIQQLNNIQEEETPSKPQQNPLDNFLLVTSSYKNDQFQINFLKEQELIQGLEDDVQHVKEAPNMQFEFLQNKQKINNQQKEFKQIQSFDQSLQQNNLNLSKQNQFQPKNFMLQLVSPSSEQSYKNIFDEKQIQEEVKNVKSQYNKNEQIHNQQDQLNQKQQQQYQQENHLINNIAQGNNQSILNSIKSQTASNLKIISNAISNKKNVNQSVGNLSKHMQQESMESQGNSNDGQLSSGQNTVIYHHSKQVSQLSQYNQSSQKNIIQNQNIQMNEDVQTINSKNQNSKDKEVDIQELSPCFSSSRMHDLDNSNSMNPLDIHKKQSHFNKSLIQNKHLNQNSIHYQPQQVQAQHNFNLNEIMSDSIQESPNNQTNQNFINSSNSQKTYEQNQLQQLNQRGTQKREFSQIESVQESQNKGDENIDSTMSGDEFVIAEYNFQAQKENDLEFSKGDKIQVLKRTQTGWWIGLCRNRIGYFPYECVSEIKFS